nr:unnamed protein product [Rangifer tarandus platyrhynchus]
MASVRCLQACESSPDPCACSKATPRLETSKKPLSPVIWPLARQPGNAPWETMTEPEEREGLRRLTSGERHPAGGRLDCGVSGMLGALDAPPPTATEDDSAPSFQTYGKIHLVSGGGTHIQRHYERNRNEVQKPSVCSLEEKRTMLAGLIWPEPPHGGQRYYDEIEKSFGWGCGEWKGCLLVTLSDIGDDPDSQLPPRILGASSQTQTPNSVPSQIGAVPGFPNPQPPRPPLRPSRALPPGLEEGVPDPGLNSGGKRPYLR